MAEYLGGLMSGWPTWLIAVAVLGAVMVSVFVYSIINLTWLTTYVPFWRKERGKK